jgi:translation initiation factor IF-1
VHYRIAGRTDVWLHGEDRLMVRMRQAQSDREYVLTRYHGGP